ncbi:hypothetical protein [Chryseobacterium lineare]
MNILIVSHMIYPFQSPRSYRTTELAVELAKNHNVTLVANCSPEEYSKWNLFNKISLKSFSKLLFIKKHSNKKEKYSLIDKILLKLFRKKIMYPNIEFLWKIPQTLKDFSDFDVLISIAAPHAIHWGCYRAIRSNTKLAKVWIADCGDPFMMNVLENPPFYFKQLEKQFMERADFVTIPIENARSSYYPEFHDKIHVIPQGFNFSNTKVFEGEIHNSVPTFAYAGVFYPEIRDPKLFLDHLCTIKDDFKFIIYTKDDSLIKDYYSRLNSKIEVREYIPRDELIYELSKMDFLINFENKESAQSPSKLIDYGLTNRPILSMQFDINNISDFDQFLRGNYSNSLEIDIDQYNIENVANRFIELINTKL